MEFKAGDKVFASRKAKGSNVLSTASHAAIVLQIIDGRRGAQQVTVQYEKLSPGFEMYGTFPYVPEGTKFLTKGQAVTITSRADASSSGDENTTQENQDEPAELPISASVDEDAGASAASAIPRQTVPTVLQLQPTTPIPAAADAAATIAAVTPNLRNAKAIPVGFLSWNAVDAIGLTVPPHIIARWKQVDSEMRVEHLFKNEHSAFITLEGIGLKYLDQYTGHTLCEKVSVRSGRDIAPGQGLIEHFIAAKIKGRTARARTKGLMFFFLACCHNDQVVFPILETQKRVRQPPFSLAEQGRLVATVNHSNNISIVSMLMTRWSRADLDAKAGGKGVAYYWGLLAKVFNDYTYVPPPCDKFAEHAAYVGDGGVAYSTELVPEYRAGDKLRAQWGKLRQLYAVFHSKYDKSGHNEPDPTCYSTDLPTLLMFWTFHSTSMSAWAAKSADEDVGIDDAGDGKADEVSTQRKRKKVVAAKPTVNAATVAAVSQMYESVHAVDVADKTPEYAAAHSNRVRRAALIFDKCLSELEKGFGLSS